MGKNPAGKKGEIIFDSSRKKERPGSLSSALADRKMPTEFKGRGKGGYSTNKQRGESLEIKLPLEEGGATRAKLGNVREREKSHAVIAGKTLSRHEPAIRRRSKGQRKKANNPGRPCKPLVLKKKGATFTGSRGARNVPPPDNPTTKLHGVKKRHSCTRVRAGKSTKAIRRSSKDSTCTRGVPV